MCCPRFRYDPRLLHSRKLANCFQSRDSERIIARETIATCLDCRQS
jgi:hypothetical protein